MLEGVVEPRRRRPVGQGAGWGQTEPEEGKGKLH